MNKENKTATEKLRELVDSDRIQHMGSMHLPPDCILELDARLSDIEARLGSFKHGGDVANNLEQLNDRLNALETSVKASEPKECICPNYRTVSCPVHDNNDEKIGCRVGKSFADPKFVESHLHDKIDLSYVLDWLHALSDCDSKPPTDWLGRPKKNCGQEEANKRVRQMRLAIEILERASDGTK